MVKHSAKKVRSGDIDCEELFLELEKEEMIARENFLPCFKE